MNLLQLSNGAKAFGGQKLFDDATFAINEGEHVGVIGPNGAGKTTLFKILIGDQELDSGTLIQSNSLRLGYLSQHDEWAAGETGNSYLERVCKLPVWQAKSMGKDLQVTDEIFQKPVMSLSGGYRMRIKLIGLLGSDPNLMLLDEPTNYLDLETTLLLERFLQNYEGAFLLISHDREFLRRTTDHILEVEAGDIVKYNGNIDDYFEQKELLRSQLEASAKNQAEKRKAVMEFVTRFGAKATKAKQAQSRLKSLQKMEVIELKALPNTSVINIPEPSPVGKIVLQLKSADYGYQDRKIIKNVNLEVRRGDHVAVVGLNGAGKSTLLKGLAGTLLPLAGSRELGYQVEIAIFNQHVVEVLDPSHSVYESLAATAHKDVTPQEIRNMAGSLLFNKDHIEKKIKVLSGGEKSRVALGRILLKKVPCLLLDEPTNHLDFQTVEALTEALKRYTGTLVVVSHDRGFVQRIATKILEVSRGQVLVYPGTYDEYVWSLQKGLASGAITTEENALKTSSTSASTSTDLSSHQQRKERDKQIRALDKKISQCEALIEKLENANREVNDQIAAGLGDQAKLVQLMSDNALQLQKVEAEWLSLGEQRDSLKNE